jgi:DNA-binding SARP family transcriptional activator/tetratricopeptide (TPR) repeat protein
VRFRVLGPVEVVDRDPIASYQLRRLLTAVLVRRDLVVTRDFLLDLLWPEGLPPTAVNSLHSKLSRLRRIVDGLHSVPGGYVLNVPSGEIDSDEFERLWRNAAAAEPGEAVVLLDAALALWRGPAYVDLEDHPLARGPAARLTEMRAGAQERLLDRLIASGQIRRAIGEAERFSVLDPFRDGICEARMRALAFDGRRVEALRVFQDYRRLLADEVGLEPAPALITLERELVRGGHDGPAPPPRRTSGVTDVRVHLPFIGYSDVVADLQLLVRRAMDGEPGVAVVQGTAGLGKTRIVRELVGWAKEEGLAIGLGAFQPQGSLPLRAIEQAFVALVPNGLMVHQASFPPISDASRSEAGSLAGAVDDAVEAAGVPGHLVVVEDLHWADAASVLFLSHLIAELDRRTQLGVPVRLAVLLTVRDDANEHRAAIARWERESPVTSFVLQGLDEAGMFQLVREALGRRPVPALVQRVIELTDGNPLLALATLRRLAAEDTLVVEGGRVHATVALTVGLPADVDDALRRVIDLLPPATITALGASAVVGTRAETALVSDVLGIDVTTLVERLSPAADNGVAAVEGDEVVFSHDLYRRAMLGRLPAEETVRWHRAAADSLDQLGGCDDRFTIRLADHLLNARSLADPRRLISACEAAAILHAANASWAEAARYFEAALGTRQILIGAEPNAADFVRVGFAHFRNHDVELAGRRLDEAIAAARRDDDLDNWGSALLVRQRIALTIGRADQPVREADYAEFLDAAGDAVPEMRAKVLAQMAEFAFAARRHEDGERWAARAARLAGSANDVSVETMTGIGQGVSHLGSLHFREADDAFRRLWEHGDVTDSWHRGAVAIRLAMIDLIRGRLDDAAEWVGLGIDLAQRARNWSELSLGHALLTMHAACRGELDGAVRAARDSFTCYERSSYRYSLDIAFPSLIGAYIAAGESAAVTETMARYQAMTGRPQHLSRLYIAATAGDDGELRRVVAARPARLPGGEQLDLHSLPEVVIAALAAVRLVDPALLEQACPPLRTMIEYEVDFPLGWPVEVGPLLCQVEGLLAAPDVTELSSTGP